MAVSLTTRCEWSAFYPDNLPRGKEHPAPKGWALEPIRMFWGWGGGKSYASQMWNIFVTVLYVVGHNGVAILSHSTYVHNY